ncbi:MAG: Lrp/AsnC family transcriptional regulator [Candidatus Heimdallarchaeota archaeon]
MPVDEKDRLILQQLRNDARMPTKRIAANLDIPRVTVHTRIEKMKDEGVILGFTVRTDYKKTGLPVTAFVFANFGEANLTQQELANQIAKLPNVYEVHLISGEWDILIKLRGESLEQIGRIVLDQIRPIKGVAKTITCAAFSTIKNGM